MLHVGTTVTHLLCSLAQTSVANNSPILRNGLECTHYKVTGPRPCNCAGCSQLSQIYAELTKYTKCIRRRPVGHSHSHRHKPPCTVIANTYTHIHTHLHESWPQRRRPGQCTFKHIQHFNIFSWLAAMPMSTGRRVLMVCSHDFGTFVRLCLCVCVCAHVLCGWISYTQTHKHQLQRRELVNVKLIQHILCALRLRRHGVYVPTVSLYIMRMRACGYECECAMCAGSTLT